MLSLSNNMKKLAIVLLGMLSMSAMAEVLYLGAQLNMATYSENGFPYENSTAVTGIIGKNFSDSFAIEGRIDISMGSDDRYFSYNGFGSNSNDGIEIDSLMSVFVKGSVPMGESAKFYGLAGVTKGTLTTTVTEVTSGISASASNTETDLSYGIGVEFGSGETTGTLEYVNYITYDSGASLSAINLGANFKF